MNKKQNNPTPQQIHDFTEYRKAIIGERLAFLNHAKQNFADSADKLAEAQELYNNSLLLTYNDYSRLVNSDHITLNDEIMNNIFNSADNADTDVAFLKSNISQLTKAIIFLNAHIFDVELTKTDRQELQLHMKTLSDYRINLISALTDQEKISDFDVLQDGTGHIPTIMNSSLDDLLVIMYEFLGKIDQWQQAIEALPDEKLSDEFEDAYFWLDEKITLYCRRKTEVTAEERNGIRSHIKHYSELATKRLGEGL